MKLMSKTFFYKKNIHIFTLLLRFFRKYSESIQNKLDILNISIDSDDSESSLPIKEAKFIEASNDVLNISFDFSIASPELIASIKTSDESVLTPLTAKGKQFLKNVFFNYGLIFLLNSFFNDRFSKIKRAHKSYCKPLH